MMVPLVIFMEDFQTRIAAHEEALGIIGVPDLPEVGPAVDSLMMMTLGEEAVVAEVRVGSMVKMILGEEAEVAKVIG